MEISKSVGENATNDGQNAFEYEIRKRGNIDFISPINTINTHHYITTFCLTDPPHHLFPV
jgi:hypothetical protein